MFVLVSLFKAELNVIKRTFDDVYGSGLNPTPYTAPTYTDKRIDISVTNAYVYNCLFRSLTNSNDGGALYCSSSVNKLLVEQSSFISCRTTSGSGGGVLFYNMGKGECVLSRICGFDCSATVYGQFARIITRTGINYKDHVNDTSLTHSLVMSSNIIYTLDLNYGNTLCPSVNITNNVCRSQTALYCYPSSSDTGCVSYSSIVNNTANDYNCIYLTNSGSSHYIDTCNILNNKQASSSYGTIYAYANLLIKDSCILGNNIGKTVFYQNYASAKITISNCTIDNYMSSGSVVFTKIPESSFIHALSHIATQSCDSYFDSYGTLTVKQNVPSQRSIRLVSCNFNCNYYYIVFSFYKLSHIIKVLQ
jgi:hypothetical protein